MRQRCCALGVAPCSRHIAWQTVETPLLEPTIEDLEAAGDARQQIVEVVRNTSLSQQLFALTMSGLDFQ